MLYESKLELYYGKLWQEDHIFKCEPDFSNRLYCCPICGDTWARWYFGSWLEWYPLSAPCPGHSWHALTLPGSLLYKWKEDLHRLTPQLLLREAQFLLGAKVNEQQVSVEETGRSSNLSALPADN